MADKKKAPPKVTQGAVDHKPADPVETITTEDVGTVSADELVILKPGLVVEVEPRIVAGAAQFSGHGGLATSPLAATIERAMSAAVEQALLDGISIQDSETILRYKQAARAAVLAADRVPR